MEQGVEIRGPRACAGLEGSCRLEFAGEKLDLLPERAVWWGVRRTLLVADVHLGKPASFRARGAPVPEGVTGADLDRLTLLVERTGAERIVVLGDLAHDRVAWRARTLSAFAAWRSRHSGVGVVLVRGNHDRWAADPPAGLAIEAVEPGWRLGPIAMHHEPPGVGSVPALCGHLHPGVALRARGKRGGLRAACYWFSGSGGGGLELGVLPAFGRFTGCAVVSPCAGDRVFAVGPCGVVEVGA